MYLMNWYVHYIVHIKPANFLHSTKSCYLTLFLLIIIKLPKAKKIFFTIFGSKWLHILVYIHRSYVQSLKTSNLLIQKLFKEY